MLENPIITLTTDFGLKDPFAGLMTGVMLGINPAAKVIDITHNIQRHNIYEASQVISMSYKYFPPTTIHVAVVDPGVGGTRRPILVVTEDHYFIGPDNGIFTPIFEAGKSGFFNKVYHLNASHYFLPMSGSTFHGRDIFAPMAAWLSKGVDSHKLGDEIDDYYKISIPTCAQSDNSLTGEIVNIDNFGNAISNIKRDNLLKLAPLESTDKHKIIYNNEQLPFVNFYAENPNPILSSIINSFGHLELFTYQDSAADKFSIKIGDKVTVTLV